MKLGTLKAGGRDGTLVVVSRDLSHAVVAATVAPTLQVVLDNWESLSPRLAEIYNRLNDGKAAGAFALDQADLAAPLPRAYQWVDGSAYLPHVERVRRARGAEMPPSFQHDPLMYQGCSDTFIGPRDAVLAADEAYGIDFEAEVTIVTDDVPMAVAPDAALGHIRLVMLVNDVSLRNLIPAELAKGFGFLQSKPASAFSPVAVTPDELGDAWRDGKLHRPLITHLNDELFGEPECGEDMQFDFGELVAHAARTRFLAAGTIVGSGTIANQDEARGASCLAEKRVLEIIRDGEATTPFMKFGDRVRIEMFDDEGATIFGAIDQEVRRYQPE
ncbi:MAG: fumarylacetoacetate hydrolase family protein [Gammaproteobacteria bacterium]